MAAFTAIRPFTLVLPGLSQPISDPPVKQIFPLLEPPPSMSILKILSLTEPRSFEEACASMHLTLHPGQLGLIPREAWPNYAIPFGVLIVTFFQKRNSKHCRFPYKLYNALLIINQCPQFYPFVGIRWVTDEVLIVEKFVFARLLGLRSVDGGLFHQQGNFPSHGFVELSFEEAQRIAAENGVADVDSASIRFMKHRSGAFRRNCAEDVIHRIEWTRS
jgi:hypothetical protein